MNMEQSYSPFDCFDLLLDILHLHRRQILDKSDDIPAEIVGSRAMAIEAASLLPANDEPYQATTTHLGRCRTK